jgi:putative transposase
MRLREKVIKLEKMLKASVHVIRAMEPSPMKRGLLGPAIQAKFSLSREAVNSLIGSASGAGRGLIPPEVRRQIVGDMERYFAQNPGHGFRMVFQAILVGQPYRRVPLTRLYKEVRERLGSGRQRSIRKIETPIRIRKPMARQGEADKMWSMDYMTDVTTKGKRFWILNIVDDFNREALVSAVAERISTKMVVRFLNALKDSGRTSAAIRTDNGMEFKGKEYITWASKNAVARVYSRPHTPTDNVLVERLNQTLRHEVLDRYLLTSIEEASRMIEDWRVRYNLARPHGSLGGLSPIQFAALNAPAP